MSFNLQTFKTRTLTAILFVAIMLVGLLWNVWSFWILFTIIHFGCWYEFVKMMKKIYGNKYIIYCLFGVGYITMPVLMMLDLRRSFGLFEGAEHFQDADLSIPLCIIFSIWINDTMAYIVGSLIGKTALAKISPKKTWEGTIGGILLSVIFIGFLYPVLMGKYLQPFIPVKAWFIIAAISAIFGTLGDLLESKLKRMADVKDSGSFMPGHGGFLDRFDSLLVGVPFVWLYVKVFL